MLSLSNKKWSLAQPEAEQVAALASGMDVSPLVATLLINRGVRTKEEGLGLVRPDLNQLHDPFLMLGMEVAVKRILEAIEKEQRITVFGDYDVDGVSAAAFLVHFFRDLGVPFSHYLPDRMKEGYGLNKAALEKIRERGSSLVITADCGITAVEEVRFAKEIGLDVIVTDHHQVSEQGLPDAVAVLNPHQPGCQYPFRFLSGVGLVFKLATGLRTALLDSGWEKDKLPNLKRHLDLLVLGTIADVVPLVGENHILARHGLEMLSNTTKPGLVALKEIAGLNGKLNTRNIAFGLAPRLNAAGRLGKPDAGLDLLTATNLAEAQAVAQELDEINHERQLIQKQTQEEADYLMDREVDLDRDRVIVLASDNFHGGVIGIVAARLAQKYFRPTVLIALKDNMGKGSARSIRAFNIYKAFKECSKYLAEFGGHAFAAGLNIEAGQIDAFRKAINEVGWRFLADEDLVQEINIDVILNLESVTLERFREIQMLEPFGQENPTPVFVSHQVNLKNLKFIGRDGQHVRFQAAQGGGVADVIGFNMWEAFTDVKTKGVAFDLVYEMQTNDWSGTERLQLKLLDIRPAEDEES